jgi:putative heme-binding domain-containing protein
MNCHFANRPVSRRTFLSALQPFAATLLLALLVQFEPQAFSATQDPIDPEVERSAFQIDPRFEVNCFASEPMLANPIMMTFDPRGRLWVICSYAYPQIKPGQQANDKLIILEDTDGDGKADKSTVFYDKLLVPTGFALGDGGVYIASPPDLLFLKDTNGDDVADESKILLSGFGTEDNHHAIHAWRWGPGGHLYFQSGVFLHTQVETPFGVTRLNDGGVFEFTPRSRRLDLYVHQGWANPWGHAFDSWGQNFLTEAPGGGIFYLLPGQVKTDLEGSYPGIPGPPKSCGVEFVSGAHMPEDLQGDMILNAFKNRVVCRYKFSDDGSGFAAKEMDPLIVSSEENFRPVDVKMGPDGAAYIADWYNPIIGHMQYNFRDPRRDSTHGRVWRVTAKGRPLLERPQLVGKPIPELLDVLKSPVDYNRYQVKRLLYDANRWEVIPALADWVNALDPKDPGFEHQRLEALWAYETIDEVNPDLLNLVLHSPEPRARAAAVRVLRDWHDRLENPLDLLAPMIADEHPRVRLEAVVALSFFPSERAINLAMMAADRTMDRYLDFALRNTARALQTYWLPRIEAGELVFEGKANRIAFALQSVHSEGAVAPLLGLLKSGDISAEKRRSVLDLISVLGGPDQLAAILELSTATHPDLEALSALSRAARERNVRPSGALSLIGPLLTNSDKQVAAEAARLAGFWKVESLRPDLTRLAELNSTPLEVRHAAVEALSELGGQPSVDVFNGMAAKEPGGESQRLAAIGLVPLDLTSAANNAASALVRLNLSSARGGADLADLLDAFLRRKGGSEALAVALAGMEIPGDIGKLALRHMYASGRQDAELAALFTKSANLDSISTSITPEEMQTLMEEVRSKGDPARGEAIFRRKDLACLQCHSILGGGGQVAPDLNGIGVSSELDYLVESVLQPGKAIREGYAASIVETDEGDVYHGIKLREDAETLVLRDALQSEILIPVTSIADRRETGTLMPDGLANLLTHGEFLDLVRFLYELGRPGPYATPNLPILRRWRILDSDPAVLAAMPPQSLDAALQTGQGLVWAPAYSEVSGILPVESFSAADPPAEAKSAPSDVAFVQSQIETTTPGAIQFLLNSPAGLSLWIDGKRIEVTKAVQSDLDRGIHTLTFQVNLKKRGYEGLKVEVGEVEGSAGRALVVSGK